MTLLVIALVFGAAGILLLWLTTGRVQLLGVAITAAALTILLSWLSARQSIRVSSLPTHESHPPQMTSGPQPILMGGETLS